MSSAYISDRLRQHITERARFCCEYCQTQEIVIGMPLEVEHILPVAAGGATAEDNLCLACPRCNRHKGILTQAMDPLSGHTILLFHPRQQQWNDHFEWSDNATVLNGLTPVGRATIDALQMNNRLSCGRESCG